MRWLFLIPLTTSLICGYISQKSADEIAYLIGVLAIVSVAMSLVMAPWQIQLLILVVVLAIARQLWLRLESGRQLQAHSPEEKSERAPASSLRKYRGISYNPTVPMDNSAQELEVEGKYRGASYKVYHQSLKKERNGKFSLASKSKKAVSFAKGLGEK